MMRHIKQRHVDQPGVDLGIDTSDQLSLRGAMRHSPSPRISEEVVLAAPPTDLPYLYPQPQFHPQATAKPEGLLSRMGRTFTVIRVLFFFAHLAITLPGMMAVGGGICATLAVAAGYKLHKAPDSKEGQAVSQIVEAKKGLLQKGMDKIKDAAVEPIGAVKESAKRGVEKAAAKAEEVKQRVDDAKDAAVEKVDEVKTAIISAKAQAPAQPGIVEQATNKAAALASNLPQGMTPDQLKAMQEKKGSSSRSRSRYPHKTRAQIAMEEAQFGQFTSAMGEQARREQEAYSRWVSERQQDFFRRLRPN